MRGGANPDPNPDPDPDPDPDPNPNPNPNPEQVLELAAVKHAEAEEAQSPRNLPRPPADLRRSPGARSRPSKAKADMDPQHMSHHTQNCSTIKTSRSQSSCRMRNLD